MAIASNPPLAWVRRVVSPGSGFCGDVPKGNGTGRRQDPSLPVDVQQERPELLPDPEAAVVGPLQGLDVEVAAGQQPLRGRLRRTIGKLILWFGSDSVM